MTYSQPQQPQSNYRPNRAALWVNQYKDTPSKPDYKGNIEISYVLFQELSAAFNSGQYTQDRGGQPCIKLDLALYVQQAGGNAPVMSGMISTPGEMQQRAAARAARQQQQPPQQQYAQPPAPMPQPQYAPQQQYAPEQPAPAQQRFDGPFPAAAAPPPAPQQQPPQQAYQQPPQPQPQAPLAPPPAGVQPMPGAIHAPQPPAAPAPTLPPGF